MAENDLFEAEESALHAAVDVHAQDGIEAASYRDALGALIVRFRRLVWESRRVIAHSDRQERELNVLNVRLRQLAAELDYKAKHDSMTGVFNRRAVIERTEELLRSEEVAMVMLDIDLFKRVNDECGHQAGDAVIVELVERLRAVAPECADIGRVGGEEFTVVLPRTNLQTAAEVAERMRVNVAATLFAMPTGRRVTASFGVSHSATGGTFKDVYGRADAALYLAKHRGRNNVVVDGQTDEFATASLF